MSLDVHGTFVSQKINKVRWIPEDYIDTNHFFTGSWDDDVNSIKIWTLESTNDEEVECPRQLSEYKVEGDVTEIKLTDKTSIAASFSNGDIKILEVSSYERQSPLREVSFWKKLHNYGEELCSCTSLDTLNGDIASVGEDGHINILSGRRGETMRTIKEADTCSLNSICFLKDNEVITGNIRGHLKIWDIRSPNDKPVLSFSLAGDELAATCIIRHPGQSHIILAGNESGAVAVWDVRVNQFPPSLINAHSARVMEMHFHPENPNRLLTCSSSGEVWDWNMETLTKTDVDEVMPLEDTSTMKVNSMATLHMAVNTLHCDKGRVLFGADNEAVYLIKNYKY